MKVLIVEDDVSSRLILKNILAKAGYDPVVARAGQSVYEILLKHDAPRLVILDWAMSGISVLKECRKIRKAENNDPAYIIILTSRDKTEDIVRGLKAGANDYVLKPYNVEELLVRLSIGRRIVELQALLIGQIKELKMLSMAVEQSMEEVVLTDLDGYVQFVNPAWAEMHGYSTGELIGKHLKVFHTEEQLLKEVIPFIEQTKKKGYHKGEVGHMRKDGTTFPTLMRVSEFRDVNRKSIGLLATAHDITERKRAEAALRESEENFRYSLDNSPLGVRIVTAEGETIYANRAILDIYGFSSLEELRTTPVEKRYTAESYIEFKKRYERRQQGEDSPSEYEVNVVRKNGEVRHLLVSRKRLLWNGKKQYQILYRDITNHKRLEQLKDEQQYLRQLEVITRELHDGIGGLAANIGVLAEIGRRQAVAEADKKIFINIADLTAEVNTEIHGLMNTLENYTIEWLDWIAECRQYGMSLMTAHGVTFNMQVKDGVDFAKGPDLLAYISLLRIFKEALTNIIKHSGASRVNVLMQFELNRFFMEIRDNGHGFAPDNVPGRGLANMRKRAMEFYGGTMIARTHNGAELKFEFPLPLKLVEKEVAGGPAKLN